MQPAGLGLVLRLGVDFYVYYPQTLCFLVSSFARFLV